MLLSVSKNLKSRRNTKKRQQELNTNSPKLKVFFAQWIDEKSETLKAGSSRKINMLALFRHTLYPLHDYRLCEITANLVYQKLSAINQTPGNKHNAITVLCQCLNSATIKGLIPVNPILKIFTGSENPFKNRKQSVIRRLKLVFLKRSTLSH